MKYILAGLLIFCGLITKGQVIVMPFNPAICDGESVTLACSGNGGTFPSTFSWSPADGLSNTTSSEVIATPSVTTTYTCTTDQGSSSVTVVVLSDPSGDMDIIGVDQPNYCTTDGILSLTGVPTNSNGFFVFEEETFAPMNPLNLGSSSISMMNGLMDNCDGTATIDLSQVNFFGAQPAPFILRYFNYEGGEPRYSLEFGELGFPEEYATLEYFVQTTPGETYEFNLYDAFGDGILYGGGVKIEECQGFSLVEVFNNYGSFTGTHDTFTITADAGGCTTIPEPSDCPSSVGGSYLKITLITDGYPFETGWEFINTSTGIGCRGLYTTTLGIFEGPDVTIGGLSSDYCDDGDPDMVTGSPVGGSFSSDAPSGVTDNGDGTATIDPSSMPAGDYFLAYTYTDGNGCTVVEQQNFTVHDAPPEGCITIVPQNPVICSGESVQLSAIGTMVGFFPSSFSWTPTSGLGAINTQNVNAAPLSTTTYTVDTDIGSAEVTVTVLPNPDGEGEIDGITAGATYCTTDGILSIEGMPSPVVGTSEAFFTLEVSTVAPINPTAISANDPGLMDNCDGTATIDLSLVDASATSSTPFILKYHYYLEGEPRQFRDFDTFTDANTMLNPIFFTITPGEEYTFTLYDLFGDGIVYGGGVILEECQGGTMVEIFNNVGSFVSNGGTGDLNAYMDSFTFTASDCVSLPSDCPSNVGGNFLKITLFTDEYPEETAFDLVNTAGSGCKEVVSVSFDVVEGPTVSIADLESEYCSTSVPSTITGTPSGGTFTSDAPDGVVDNGNGTATIEPSLIPTGTTFNITYTVDDGTCVVSEVQQFSVLEAPVVSLSGIEADYCADDPPVTLIPSPAGGSYFSTLPDGVLVGNVIDISQVPTGVMHYLEYSYTDGNGCTNYDLKMFTVHDLPDVSFSGLNATYCENDPVVTLIGNPSGGTFSTDAPGGLTDNFLDPTQVPVGTTYNITYTYNDGMCESSEVQSFIVYDLPIVTLSGLEEDYCTDDPAVTLMPNPPGGTYFSTLPPGALVGNVLDISLVPTGIMQYLEYTYVDANGCSNFDLKMFTVHELPTVSFSGLFPAYCTDDPVVTLVGNPPGGTFSTDAPSGLTGDQLDPSQVPAGTTYSITYNYNDGLCENFEEQNFTVIPDPPVDTPDDVTACEFYTLPPLTNGAYFASSGGVDPIPEGTDLLASQIVYIFAETDGIVNCTNEHSFFVTINFPPTATLEANAETCNTGVSGMSTTIDFTALVTAGDMGGSWDDTDLSGANLSDLSNVDFNGVTPGTYTFTYTTNSALAPCSESSYTTEITVNDCSCPIVETSAPSVALCSDSGTLDLTTLEDPNIEPGSWSITSAPAGSNPAVLVGAVFTVNNSDAGSYTVTYTLDSTPGGVCPASSSETIIVNEIPSVSIMGLDTDYCENDPFVNLVGSPPGGDFSTNAPSGLIGNILDPSLVPTETTYFIEYAYTDGNGCSNIVQQNFIVHDLPVVSFSGLDAVYCSGAPLVTLIGTPPGGTFFTNAPNGLAGNILDPSLVPTGTTYFIEYSYTDGNGCMNYGEQSFIVNAIPTPSDAPISICDEETSTNLSLNDATVLDGEIGAVTWFDGDPNGGGTPIIDPTDVNLNTIAALYAQVILTSTGCEASIPISVTIHTTPMVDTPLDVTACDAYILPNLSVGGYFTNSGGIGPIADGTSISTTQTIFIYAESGTIPNCTSEHSFTVTINNTPAVDDPSDVTSCDSYILPALTNGAYYSASGGIGFIAEGTEIISSQTIFVYAETGTVPNCSAENSFVVTIVDSPTFTATSTNENCPGDNDGEILIEVLSGMAPFDYQINGGSFQAMTGTTITLNNLAAGSYDIVVMDDNTCLSLPQTVIIATDNLSDINIQGNGLNIENSDATPAIEDGTDFEFVNVTAGSEEHIFSIQNLGTTTLNIIGISSNDGQFTVDEVPATVAGGNTETFTITFDPDSDGLQSAIISIESDDCDEGTYTFSVQGTGAFPEIDVLGNNISIPDGDMTPELADNTDFGEAGIGGGMITKTFVIENTGDAELNLTGSGPVEMVGSLAFTIIEQPTTPIPANGGTSSLIIKFEPSVMGTHLAFISIPNDDPDEDPYDFVIWGVGSDPEILLSGNGLEIVDGDDTPDPADFTDFGSADISGETVTHTFVIENTGVLSLNLTGDPRVEITGVGAEHFVVTSLPTTPITGGSLASFMITFQPTVNGTHLAEVSIANDDASENPYNFTIRGVGTGFAPDINILGGGISIVDGDEEPEAADDTDFGELPVDGSMLSHTFVIENLGNADLLLTGFPVVEIGGDNPQDFQVTIQPPFTLINPSSSTNFTVKFTPTDLGTRSAAISIANNDTLEDPYNFNIQGTGICPIITPPVSDGDQFVCEGDPLTSISVSVGFGETVDWYDADTGGTLLQAGSTSFTPTVAGTYYAETRDAATNCISVSRTAVSLSIIDNPEVDIPADVMACDFYILPALMNGNYFSSGGGVGPIAEGTEISASQTIFVFAETGTSPNCTSESSFDITIIETPLVDAPVDVAACDSYTLPPLTNGDYYSESGGIGFIPEGTIINTTQEIFVYSDTGTDPNCSAENSFIVTIFYSPILDTPSDVAACDYYILPDLTIGAYFSESGGVGPIPVGTEISASQTIFIYAETGTVPNCTSETSFDITIIETPLIDDPEDVVSCNIYLLPPLTNGAYYSTTGGVGPIPAGTPITSSQTIYVYAESGTIPNCTAENSFNITINYTPSASLISSADVCNTAISGMSTFLDFSALILAGDMGGTWADTDGSGVDLSNSSSVNFNGVAPGNYTFTYTTNSALPPCTELSYTTEVTVSDCSCPNVITNAPTEALCSDAGSLDLTTLEDENIEPGSWSITNTPTGNNPAVLIGNNFTTDNSDPGTYTVTYTLDTPPNGVCPPSSSEAIVVNPRPDVSIVGLSSDFCIDDSPVVLIGSPSGGSFSTNAPSGLVGNILDPALVPTETEYFIEYAYTDGNGCSNTVQQSFIVHDLPVVTFEDLPFLICSNDESIFLNVSPLGGTFSTNAPGGLTGSLLHPSQIPTGVEYFIEYSYTDGNGCMNTASQNFMIEPAPSVNLNGLPDTACATDDLIVLAGTNLTGTVTLIPDAPNGVVEGDDFYLFNPGAYPDGETVVVTYSENIGNCFDAVSDVITVFPETEVGIDGLVASYCENAGMVLISGNPISPAGVFSSNIPNGFVDNGDGTANLDPALSGTGDFEITYNYTDINGCMNTASQNVSIEPAPNVSLDGMPDTACASEDLIALSGTNLMGAVTISPNVPGALIEGADSYLFNPAAYPDGAIVEITYSEAIGDCTDSVTEIITIFSITTVSIEGLSDSYCENDGSIMINGTPLLPAGVFSSNIPNGFVDNGDGTASFDPALSGTGDFEITYTYTDENGCTTSQTESISILESVTATIQNLPSGLCTNEALIQISGNPQTGGQGSFSTNLVDGFIDNGDGTAQIDPGLIAPGEYDIEYTFVTDLGCESSITQSINIFEVPSVSFTPIAATYAINSPSLEITGDPLNGVFESIPPGNIVDNGDGTAQINPSNMDLEIPIEIIYTVTTDDGCTNQSSQTTTVLNQIIASFSGLPAEICEEESSFTIIGSPMDANGSFSSTIPGDQGLTDNGNGTATIDPGQVPAETTFEITYSYLNTSNNETTSQTQEFIVHAGTTLNIFGLESTYCEDDTAIEIQGNPMNENGTFSSTQPQGFSDNGDGSATIDPSNTPPGTYMISYSYINVFGCESEYTETYEVVESPEASFSGITPGDICYSNGVITLFPSSPGAGTFSTNPSGGVSYTGDNATFDPTFLSDGGMVEISYVLANAAGCEDSFSIGVNVIPPVDVDIDNLNNFYLQEDPPFIISGFPGGNGGLFSTNIPSNGFIDNGDGTAMIDPGQIPVGSYEVTYTFTDDNGCISQISNSVEFSDILSVSILGLDDAYCQSDDLVLLLGVPGDSNGMFSTNSPGITDNGDGTATIDLSQTNLNETITIQYSYTHPVSGQVFETEMETIVWALPDISFTGLNSLTCLDGALVELNGSEDGGFFFTDPPGGIDMIGDQSVFNPLQFPQGGSVTIFYEFTSAEGCTNTVEQTTELIETPSANFTSLDPFYCGITGVLEIGGIPSPPSGFTASFMSDLPAPAFIDNGDGTAVLNFDLIPEGMSYFISYVLDNGAGCEDVQTQNIEIGVPPVVSFTSLSGIYCSEDGMLLLEGNPLPSDLGNAIFYTDQAGDPGLIDNGDGTASLDLSMVPSGVDIQIFYELTDGGCTSINSQSTFVVNPEALTMTPLDDEYCADGLLEITVSPLPDDPSEEGSFQVNIPNGFTDNGDGTATIDLTLVPQGSTLSVIYIFENGCMSTVQETFMVLPTPEVSFTPLEQVLCNNEAPVPLTGSPIPDGNTIGVFSSNIPGNQGLNDNGDGTGNIDPANIPLDSNFEIYYTYTDENGCIAIDTQSILVAPEVEVFFTGITEPSVCSDALELVLTPSHPGEGTWVTDPPNLLFVTDDQATLPLTGFPDGTEVSITYSLTSGGECAEDFEETIQILSAPELELGDTLIFCTEGTIALELDNPDYQVLWSTGSTDPEITVTEEGLYEVSITADNGCEVDQSVEVLISSGLEFLSNFLVADRACTGDTIHFIDISEVLVNVTAYNWDFGDGNTSTERDPTHVYNSPGIYEVELEALSEDCSNISIRKPIEITNCRRLPGSNIFSAIEVYPNPSSGDFKIDIQLLEKQPVQVKIFDFNGRERSRWDLNYKANYELNIEEFERGVYTIQVQSLNEREVRKVVIF